MPRKLKIWSPVWTLNTPKGKVYISKRGKEFLVECQKREGKESVERSLVTQTHIMALWKMREWLDEILGEVISEELDNEAEKIK